MMRFEIDRNEAEQALVSFANRSAIQLNLSQSVDLSKIDRRHLVYGIANIEVDDIRKSELIILGETELTDLPSS